MKLLLRIGNDEIPSFITGCAVDALQWEVDGKSLNHKIYCSPRDPRVLNLNAKKLREAVTSIVGQDLMANST